MKEIIDLILNNLKQAEAGDDFALLGKKYVPVTISKSNFHPISEAESDKTMTFYDGGNLSLIEAPNMVLHFVRLASISYKNNKKIKASRKEFYCLVSSKKEKYYVKTIPEQNGMDIEIHFHNKDLMLGSNKVEIRLIPGLIRRLAEISFVKGNIGNSDYHVMDGTLESNSLIEDKCLKELIAAIKKEKKELFGVSKTNTITTNNGNSLSTLLASLNPDVWQYFPIVKQTELAISMIRLHKKSEHVFRLDSVSENVKEALWLLNENSQDPVFLGYPYGLIQVDSMARVAKKEAECLKTSLMVRFGKDWSRIKPYVTALNAHEILDSIS
jgi:hypothetical protein